MRPFTIRNAGTTVLALLTLACHKAKPDPGAPDPDAHPLGGIVGQPLVVAPVQGLRVVPELGWSGLPRSAVITAALDSAVAEALRARVSNQQWVYSDALTRSFENNRTYVTDPRTLSVGSLRSAGIKVGDRLLEPLASQLRTMIAVQDARLVLIPTELRFDRAPTGQGRPVVRLVLVDPRSSIIRWFGDVTGADAPTFTSAFSASLADRVADLFVPK